MPSGVVQDLLRNGTAILLDGGLATQIESMGYKLDSDLWSALLIKTHPRVIVEAHKRFLQAGSQIIITSSYQGSKEGFMEVLQCNETEAVALLKSSVELAKIARAEYLLEYPGGSKPPLIAVAASCGPYGAILHDGSEYTGNYSHMRERAVNIIENFHRDRLALLDSTGADIIAIETIPSGMEAKILLHLTKTLKTPYWISYCCKDGFHLSDGTKLFDVVREFVDEKNCVAIGVNCCSPDHVDSLLTEARRALGSKHKPIIAYPNSGETWDSHEKHWAVDNTENDRKNTFEQNCCKWVEHYGVSIIGGCCRVNSMQIAKLKSALQIRGALKEQAADEKILVTT